MANNAKQLFAIDFDGSNIADNCMGEMGRADAHRVHRSGRDICRAWKSSGELSEDDAKKAAHEVVKNTRSDSSKSESDDDDALGSIGSVESITLVRHTQL